ncbi:MAG: 16S rRNA (cytidine(1402)-2'-O)-methyltransferase [Nitrospirae bacterium]|nr:16S rRNA (cytidine(1402)-2'-O)-methyltransferase [Nitrospirota bacterium]MBF0616627.1 16S rRNA (cytidine(1402)-2'-O)-methyltransferase [Nitrospirota bacterium]
MKGDLYVVSTPIGNLEDITLRALRVLKEVDIIAVEDTRRTIKLLNHFDISKPMISYYREKERVRSQEVIDKINDGFSAALVTDAGTPGISDPGEVLVKEAIAAGINVIAVPGATAHTAALSISGLPTGRFTFAGFLSSKPTHRKKQLAELKGIDNTLVFYEAPHRILEFLDDLLEVFGNREMSLSREITKMYEETLRGSVSYVLEEIKEHTIAGEYVAVVAGIEPVSVSFADALKEVRGLISAGAKRKEAVEEVSLATGISKKLLYKESLETDGVNIV